MEFECDNKSVRSSNPRQNLIGSWIEQTTTKMSFFSSSSTSTADVKSPEAGTMTAESTSVVSALASTPSSAGGDHDNGGDNTPHYHFIHSMILPSTMKIQKEMRGWKFKVRLRCSSLSRVCTLLLLSISLFLFSSFDVVIFIIF